MRDFGCLEETAAAAHDYTAGRQSSKTAVDEGKDLINLLIQLLEQEGAGADLLREATRATLIPVFESLRLELPQTTTDLVKRLKEVIEVLDEIDAGTTSYHRSPNCRQQQINWTMTFLAEFPATLEIVRNRMKNAAD